MVHPDYILKMERKPDFHAQVINSVCGIHWLHLTEKPYENIYQIYLGK